MSRSRHACIALGLALLARASVAAAQSRSASFVVTAGTDTVAVESYSVTPYALTGTLRLPQQQARARYVIQLRRNGSIAEADVTDDARNFFSGTITFDEEAAVDARAMTRRRFIMAPPATYPLVGTSLALMEQLARVTHATTRDSTTAQVFNIRNRILGTATLQRVGRDSLVITCAGCQRPDSRQVLHVGISPQGDFTGGKELVQEWVITRH
ncbi:MAG: hypothetical protein M3Z05_13245 [Gemmatimonadota bacterium]|nr:hypothetical protein [Gemmatimonadota bacterium]